MATWPRAALLGILGLTAGVVQAETLVLRNGDRISGKLVARGTRRLRLQTPYGVLSIPRERIEKVVHDDGREELLTDGAPVSPAPPLRLVLVVSGATFWQAWDPKAGAPADSSLRLEVRLDENAIARYVDGTLDPQDIPGAVVNTFSFTRESLRAVPDPSVELVPPAIQPGRIALELRLPRALLGPRRLGATYQVNDGTVEEPVWRDAVGCVVEITLGAESPTVVLLQQERGRMEFAGLGKRRMKNVETFRLLATPE